VNNFILSLFEEFRKYSAFKMTCQSRNFGKSCGMKSISEPRLPIEMYTFSQNLSTGDFRKKPVGRVPNNVMDIFESLKICAACQNPHV